MFAGTGIKGEMVAPHSTLSTTLEEHTAFYFNTYSRDYLVKVYGLFYQIHNFIKCKMSKHPNFQIYIGNTDKLDFYIHLM